MRFHDYHLSKYEVSDFGETITLHLVFDYPEREKHISRINFTGVALYHFTHSMRTIILDIEECPVAELLEEAGRDITEWSRRYGVRLWEGAIDGYRQRLQSDDYKAWRIESSIGFYGFVIAKAVSGS